MGKTRTGGTVRGDLLRDAADATEGPRGETHGDAVEQHKTAAALWSSYLGVEVTADQVCVCMALLKVSRLKHGQPERDHYMDAAAYLAIAHEAQG